MGLLTVEIARPLDFLETLDDLGRPACRTRRQFGLQARQVAGSQALTWRAAGELVAIVGLWPLDDTRKRWEGWFAAGEALKPHLLPLIRDMKADAEVVDRLVGPGGEILAYMAPASVAGPRVARWLGFQPCGPTRVAGHDLDTWRRRT